MPTYTYQAKDGYGRILDGTLEAENLAVAAERLRQMGYTPTRLELLQAPAPSPTLELAGSWSAQPTPLAPLAEPEPMQDSPIQPWERGGPVAPANPVVAEPTQSVATPTISMNAPQGQRYAATIASTSYSARERGAAEHSGATKGFSLYQRFLETCIYPVWSGVFLGNMVEFYRQFAALINAGMSLYQALSALEANTKNGQLKKVIRDMKLQAERGGRLSEVMARYPWVFPPMHVSMVHAAEQGGMLDDVFRQLAEYVEHEVALRRVLRMETFYPKLVIFVAFMILGRGFLGSNMPAISELVLSGLGKAQYSLLQYLNDTLVFGLELLLPFLALVVIFRLFLFNIKGVRETYDTLKTSLPGLGKLVKTFATAKFLRTYAALYHAGFPMSETVRIAGEASGNVLLRNAALQAMSQAQWGGAVSDALYRSGFLDPVALNMLRTGEMSGNLEEILQKTADYYEQEGQVKARQWAIAVGVIVFLFVAIVVAMFIVRFYSGYAAGVTSAGG
ncbi:type II secretory pathway, component PulF [Chthonomonas calidirosea]|uniref:type II secretion system F family protein n=1 Tax=Chthonomonas calidirosea TaxID=454171 RepID=UPI0006DD55D7|nr:type II secretion system F family protein [Chthonomonas calidirosea]CEK15739.1 type II secretory pathway, component PulF [Chthonomonas calidirosea]